LCTSIQNFGVLVLKQRLSNTSSSQPAPRHDVVRSRTLRPRTMLSRRPGRRAFPRLRADRGRAPSPGSRAPRCHEARVPRATPPSRRTCSVHAVDRRSVRVPTRTRASRGTPYHGSIFVADVVATRAGLFKHHTPSRAACRATLAVRPHGCQYCLGELLPAPAD
jgi:hypothetical protein